MNASPHDPFDLRRFQDAQSDTYNAALSELRAGRKRTHWMWFVFPQVSGLGSSTMAKLYAIRSREEAVAFLNHDVLGKRLRDCANALLAVDAGSAEQVMGYPDCLKLKSSMTLFAEVAEPGSVFAAVLDKFFGGKRDSATIRFLSERGLR